MHVRALDYPKNAQSLKSPQKFQCFKDTFEVLLFFRPSMSPFVRSLVHHTFWQKR